MKINFKFLKDLSSKDRITLVISIFILGLALISFPINKKINSDIPSYESTSKDYKENLENQLEEILSQVTGVGDVNVMITLSSELNQAILFNESTSESISTSQNERSTSEINSTKEAIMIKDSQGTVPYTISEAYPAVNGVIVVAEGANDPQIKAYIIQAVKAALEVAAHKIVVLPKAN